MGSIAWTVKVGPFGSETTMTDVMDLSFNSGITQVTDQLRSGQCTVRGRVPTSQPPVAVGDRIQFEAATPLGTSYYTYRVKNYVINYGIVPAEDEWVLTGEDVFAVLGRATVSVSWAGGARTNVAAKTLTDATGLNINVETVGQSLVSAQSLTNVNALAELSKIAQTEQAAVYSYSVGTVWWKGRGWQSVATTGYLADDGSTSGALTTLRYDSLEFGGIADNFADRVVVNPAGLAQQVAGSGDYSYTVDSYDQTTSQAAGLAAYVEGILTVQNAVPYRVSLFQEAQSSYQLIGIANNYIKLGIKFRTNLYEVFVIGFSVTASPQNGTRVSLDLSSAEAVQYFILNSPTFGTLDSNRLGF